MAVRNLSSDRNPIDENGGENMLWKKIGAILVAASITLAVSPQAGTSASAHTVSYRADNSTAFANPERGFHNRYEIIDDVNVNDYASSATSIAGFNPDMLDRTFARAKADGNTIIHSYIHLDKYKTSDLPEELLDNLASGLAAVRQQGLKVVLRPAYAWSDSPSVSEEQIMRHIEQLGEVFTANSDVIFALEAGYLGPWGEWHDAPYCAFTNRSEADTRYRIIKKIMAETPANIPVAMRYPIFIREIQYLSDHDMVPAGSTPLTQQERDRIGFHNDAFLADSADCGTYDNPTWMDNNHYYTIEEKRQWMYDMETSEGYNTYMGGESMDSSGNNDAAGNNVQSEMARLNTSELNEDYAKVNTDIWKNADLPASGNDPAETAFQRIKRKMGYRIRLIDATFSTTAAAGQSFAFSAHLANDGYAGPIKQRPLYAVFDNGSDRYNILLENVDVRSWLSGSVDLPQQTVALPEDMRAGTYRFALWLPDSAPGLQSRPEYSIRFANLGVWDAEKGYNVLSDAVTVASGTKTVPVAPENLKAAPGNQKVSLTWDRAAWAESYDVLRSTDDGSGYVPAASGVTAAAYTDTNLKNGTRYYYVVRSRNDLGVSGNSAQASAVPASDTVRPSAPSGLTCTGVTTGSVTLAWNASTDDTGVSEYDVSRNGAVVGSSSATKYTDGGLAPNTSYTYRVTAKDSAGNVSEASPALTVSTADPDPGLILDDYDGSPLWPGTNDLNAWTGANGFLNGSSGAGAVQDGALVLQYNNAGWFGSDVNRDVSQYQDLVFRIKGSKGGEQDSFKLRIGNAYKLFSDFTSVPITTSYQDIRIDMEANGINRSSPGQLDLEFWYGKAGTIFIDEIRFAGKSSGTADTQPPSAPQGLKASGVTSDSAAVAWSASSDNVGVTGYDVYRNGTLAGTVSAPGYTDGGLSPDTAYVYTVRAKDAAGNLSEFSAPLRVTTQAAGTEPEPPARETSYEAESPVNTLSGGAAIADAPGCSGGKKVGYIGNNGGVLRFNQVESSEAGNFVLTLYYLTAEDRNADLSVNGAPASRVSLPSTGGWDTVGMKKIDVSLHAGENTIQIANTDGWAPDIDRISVNIPDTEAPSVPQDLKAADVAESKVTLTWTASTDNVAVDHYEVFRDGAKVGSPSGSSYQDSGLAPDTEYTYTVKALDAAGNASKSSNAVSVRTAGSSVPPGGDTPVGAGVPAFFSSPEPDTSLAAHGLAEGTAPVDNPLKGLLYWWYQNDNPDLKITPTSMEWHYFGLGDLMTGPDSYNWEPMEEYLDQVAAHGNQACLRVTTNISFGGKDIPDFLQDLPLTDGNLPYDNPRVVSAFTNFIRAFGREYDGDPRIGFLTMGLVGKWGEWHTWPYEGGDNGNPDLMPSRETCETIINAYHEAFRITPLEIRYPRVAGGTLLASLADIGYHDDSFGYRENDPVLGRIGSMTLPMSLGGKTDSLVTQELTYGVENKWLTASIGGEVRPEIQGQFTDPANQTKDDPIDDIEVSHATWMMCNQAAWPASDSDAMNVLRKFGYNLVVRKAFYNSAVSGMMKIGVQIENTGVAPFYYGPGQWPVLVGLKDASGNVVKTWRTDWDLRKVVPSKIRALPEWNLQGNPKYVAISEPYYFETSADLHGVAEGAYTLVMRVRNPLELLTKEDLADHNDFSWQPYKTPKKLYFANQEQNADGWLSLGNTIVD